MRFLAPLALTALTGALLTGCSDHHDPVVDPETNAITRGIDAEKYVEDYEEQQDEDSAGSGVSYSGSAPMAASSDGQELVPPLPDEDNTFVDAGTSGVVETADDPLSTFGLDVDTGSLGVARTLLKDGYVVPPESVRAEEWVNALPYDDPAPTDADLALTTEAGIAPTLHDGTQVVRVAVAAREVVPAHRPRVNVTLVVDRSGSMDIRDRLGLVQSSLALLADRLRDDDTVSVVSFEDEATPLLEPTPVADTDAILDAVERLRPGGSTNLEAGVRLGYEQARAGFDPDAVNLVVLCSDGVANVGRTGPGSITDLIAREGADGIHLVTVGFGMGNYNDHLMEQLADRGDGFYAYVDTFDEAERLFGRDLTTTLVPVAEEARAQVEFDPAAVTSYRLIGYENRAIADDEFEDLGVDAGELGSGHHATALYEVALADAVVAGDPLGTASVRWRSTDGRPSEASTQVIAAAAGAQPSANLALATTAADLAQLLKSSPDYAERGVTLEDLATRAADLQSRDVPGADQLAELVDLARPGR
jgi:Ca-activated chloride channel family protein